MYKVGIRKRRLVLLWEVVTQMKGSDVGLKELHTLTENILGVLCNIYTYGNLKKFAHYHKIKVTYQHNTNKPIVSDKNYTEVLLKLNKTKEDDDDTSNYTEV